MVLGVNFDKYDASKHDVISNASCTTNCLAPVAKVLHDAIGIKHGLMTTIHAYTADQRLQDMPHSDLRRARAAAQPDPDLDRRRQGDRPHPRAQRQAPRLRDPRAGPTGLGRRPDLSRPSARRASRRSTRPSRRPPEGDLKGILAYTEDPIVSSTSSANPDSSIVDAELTAVIDGTLVKVVSWYDNEWGYSNRLVDLVQKVL